MRTLDDIVPPSRRKEAPAEAPEVLRPRSRRGFPWVTALITLLVIAGAGVALWYYSGASVEVTPNSNTVTASGSYSAAASGGALTFQIITADKIATQSVASSGTQVVNSYAQGTITISNKQSSVQKLITNTRFSSTAGLVFRIHAPVTIPANGSVQATVYADQPGASYNIAPSSFTVPGLTGAAHEAVTAQSSASMAGGASGAQPVVADATAAAARSALSTALAPDLAQAIASQVPAGYVLLPGAATTSYRALDSAPSSATGQVDLKEEGTITAVVVPNAALASALATQVEGPSYTGEPVTIANPSALTLTPTAGFPTASSQAFAFTLSGTAHLVSTIDPNQIASAIAGKTRTAAEVALTNFPSVKQAVLILRPFWASTFPEDPAKINVVVEPAQ
jgi:hypothetical protein